MSQQVFTADESNGNRAYGTVLGPMITVAAVMLVCLISTCGCGTRPNAKPEGKTPQAAKGPENEADKKQQEALNAQLEKIPLWVDHLGDEDASKRQSAADALLAILEKTKSGTTKEFVELKTVIHKKAAFLRKAAKDSDKQVQGVVKKLLLQAGFYVTFAPTGKLIALVQKQFESDRGKSGGARSFAKSKDDFLEEVGIWWGHGTLANVVHELGSRGEEARVAVPLLRAYFDDLRSLTVYRLDSKPSTLGEQFKLGAPTLADFDGLYHYYRALVLFNRGKFSKYEEAAKFDTGYGKYAEPHLTVALLLMNEMDGAIKKLGDPEESFMVAMLKHPDPVVRDCAARWILKLGPTEEASAAEVQLVLLLKDKDEKVQFQAALDLVKMNPVWLEKGSKWIAEGLKTGSAQEKQARIGQTVPILVEVILKEKHKFRVRAIDVLGEIGPPAKSAVPVISALLGDPSSEVRQKADFALTKLIPDEAERERVQFKAVLDLVKAYPAVIKTVADRISKGLKTGSASEKKARVEQVVPLLVAVVLKETQWQPRASAVDLLGEIGPPAKSAVPAISALLNDASVELRQRAAAALDKINSGN